MEGGQVWWVGGWISQTEHLNSQTQESHLLASVHTIWLHILQQLNCIVMVLNPPPIEKKHMGQKQQLIVWLFTVSAYALLRMKKPEKMTHRKEMVLKCGFCKEDRILEKRGDTEEKMTVLAEGKIWKTGEEPRDQRTMWKWPLLVMPKSGKCEQQYVMDDKTLCTAFPDQEGPLCWEL